MDNLENEVNNIFGLDDFSYQPKFGGSDGVYLKFNDWNETEQSEKIRIVTPTHTRIEFRRGEQVVDTKDWDISDIKEALKDDSLEKSQKFSWVVLVRNGDKSPVAKVYEAGSGVFKKISAIASDPEWQPITETDLKITRKGIRKDARYDIMPSPSNRGKISDDEFAIADEVKLTKYIPQAMTIKKFVEIFGE